MRPASLPGRAVKRTVIAQRWEIRKVVFTYDASDLLIETMRNALPDAVVRVTGPKGDLRHEIVDDWMTIGSGLDPEILQSPRQRMKPGSYFHNLGRGGTVDHDALVEALHSGHLAGAGLDVTEPKPLPEDSPLWDAPNTIISGHTSGNSPLFAQREVGQLRENLRRWQAGEDLVNVVDLEYGYYRGVIRGGRRGRRRRPGPECRW